MIKLNLHNKPVHPQMAPMQNLAAKMINNYNARRQFGGLGECFCSLIVERYPGNDDS